MMNVIKSILLLLTVLLTGCANTNLDDIQLSKNSQIELLKYREKYLPKSGVKYKNIGDYCHDMSLDKDIIKSLLEKRFFEQMYLQKALPHYARTKDNIVSSYQLNREKRRLNAKKSKVENKVVLMGEARERKRQTLKLYDEKLKIIDEALYVYHTDAGKTKANERFLESQKHLLQEAYKRIYIIPDNLENFDDLRAIVLGEHSLLDQNGMSVCSSLPYSDNSLRSVKSDQLSEEIKVITSDIRQKIINKLIAIANSHPLPFTNQLTSYKNQIKPELDAQSEQLYDEIHAFTRENLRSKGYKHFIYNTRYEMLVRETESYLREINELIREKQNLQRGVKQVEREMIVHTIKSNKANAKKLHRLNMQSPPENGWKAIDTKKHADYLPDNIAMEKVEYHEDVAVKTSLYCRPGDEVRRVVMEVAIFNNSKNKVTDVRWHSKNRKSLPAIAPNRTIDVLLDTENNTTYSNVIAPIIFEMPGTNQLDYSKPELMNVESIGSFLGWYMKVGGANVRLLKLESGDNAIKHTDVLQARDYRLSMKYRFDGKVKSIKSANINSSFFSPYNIVKEACHPSITPQFCEATTFANMPDQEVCATPALLEKHHMLMSQINGLRLGK